jgi:DNA-directed RNA polymerase specialized sigma24 family protein
MMAAYDGPEWKRFSLVLAEYGLQVMIAWVRKGTIFEQCKKKGLGLSGVMSRSFEDVGDLAADTVAAAIVVFRDKVLIPHVWDPSKGASLKTFFIGQCVFQFPNIYRRWHTEKCKAHVAPEVVAQELEHARTRAPSTETLAELSRQVEQLDPDSLERAEMMIEMGYSMTEIAERFRVTERALDSKLYRFRRTRA